MADFCKRQNYLPHNLALHFAKNKGFHGDLTVPTSIHDHYICEYFHKYRSDFRVPDPILTRLTAGFRRFS